MTTLLPDRDLTPEEREAVGEVPRPGLWAGEPGADLRALTQDATDDLVRFQLTKLTNGTADATPLLELIGSRAAPLLRDRATGGLRRESRSTRLACQRGGIDSDPMVRLLAFRTWGDRDRRWFELRGVRAGDQVTMVGAGDGWGDRARRWHVALAWPGEPALGRACNNAAPGERIEIAVESSSKLGAAFGAAPRSIVRRIVRASVSDRLREESTVTWLRHDATRLFDLVMQHGARSVRLRLTDAQLETARDPSALRLETVATAARALGLGVDDAAVAALADRAQVRLEVEIIHELENEAITRPDDTLDQRDPAPRLVGSEIDWRHARRPK